MNKLNAMKCWRRMLAYSNCLLQLNAPYIKLVQ